MKNKQRNARARAKASQMAKFGDGIVNFPMRVGARTGNLFSDTRYQPGNIVTLNRIELEQAYMSSWIVALAIDVVAEDMTREGVDILTDSPEEEAKINRCFDSLRVWENLATAIKWARLYGGSLGIIMIEGEDASEPLNINKIKRGSFKGVFPIDRWQLVPSTKLVSELGTHFGKPETYTVVPNGSIEFPSKTVHYSRVIRFIGRELPWYLAQQQQGWGASILESLWSRVMAYDLASEGTAQLVQKAHLRFYQVNGLRDVLSTGDDSDAYKGLLKQFEIIRQMQSIEGLTVGDTEDAFSAQSYQFSGLPDVLLSFAQQISGAIQVPLVRLLGQSPAGLNSSGDSDLRTYYDGILYKQESMLRGAVGKLLKIAYKSELEKDFDEESSFTFRNLWQMTEEQKATVTTATVSAILQAMDSGAINQATALRELKSMSEVVGAFSSINDEMIQEAEEVEKNLMPPEPSSFNQEETNGEEEPSATQTGKA